MGDDPNLYERYKSKNLTTVNYEITTYFTPK